MNEQLEMLPISTTVSINEEGKIPQMTVDKDYLDKYLRGYIDQEIVEAVRKLRPRKSLRVFVSSTFTDTHLERNTLHKDILPTIQQQAILDDIQVILFDMRFGVKDENTIDHMTWNICKDGIKQCYDESDGIFFLSLQSDKYGYCPLPKFLDRIKLDQFIALYEEGNAESISLLKAWYELDYNSIPERYVLKSLIEPNLSKEYYEHILPTLRDDFLDSFPFEILNSSTTNNQNNDDEDEILCINRSVTEWETLYALSLKKEGCAWIKRTFLKESIKELSSQERGQNRAHHIQSKLWEYCDTWDSASKQKKLEILKVKMESLISDLYNPSNSLHLPSFIMNSQAILSSTKEENKTEEQNETTEYLSKWKTIILQLFTKQLKEIQEKEIQWKTLVSSISSSLALEIIDEIFIHHQLAFTKSNQFVGREELLQSALNKLFTLDDNNEKVLLKRTNLISFAVIGKSGTGKTAFMSKLFSILRETSPTIPFIIRFCGISKYSLHGIHLIQSISLQIYSLYQQQSKIIALNKKLSIQTYDEAIHEFHQILKEYPIFLFIDSLDQLSNKDEARSKLKFLLFCSKDNLHPDSRIIVSTLPDEKDRDNYLFHCEKRLKEANIPFLTISSEINEEENSRIKKILQELLHRRGRSLTTSQWEMVTPAVIQEPTMLYLQFALHVITKWNSFDDKEPNKLLITPTVKGITHQIFDDLSRDFGKELVSWSFALITFSREGINDLEMKECLQLQPKVLHEVFQYSIIDSFPILVWLRLKIVIQDFITERGDHHCITWYHRQLMEIAQERYQSLRIDAHRIMGKYFNRSSSLSLNTSTVWHSQAKIDTRAVKEGYYHLMEANNYEAAMKIMCSLKIVYASAKIGDTYHLVKMMARLFEVFGSSQMLSSEENFQINTKKVKDYYQWLRREVTTISKQLLRGISTTISHEPSSSILHEELRKVIYLHSQPSQFLPGDTIWCYDLGREMIQLWESNFIGHTGAVSALAIDPVHRNRIASGSWDKTVKIWNLQTGELIHTIDDFTEWIDHLHWSLDGSKLIIQLREYFVKVYDTKTWEMLFQFDKIYRIHWNQQETKWITISIDNQIQIWDTSSGECLSTFPKSDEGIKDLKWRPIDESQIAFCCFARKEDIIQIWNIHTNECLYNLKGHKGSIYCINWNYEGTKLASAGKDMTIRIWDLSSPPPAAQSAPAPNPSAPQPAAAAAAPSTGKNKSNKQSEQKAKQQPQSQLSPRTQPKNQSTPKQSQPQKQPPSIILTGHRHWINSIRWNSQGTHLLSASSDGSVFLWDILERSILLELTGHHGEIYDAIWNDDETKIISSGDDKTIKIWDLSTLFHQKDQHHHHEDQQQEGHLDKIRCVSFHPNGNQIASSSFDKTIKIWQTESHRVQYTLSGHQDVVKHVAWHPRENKLASASGDQTIKIWDLDQSNPKEQLFMTINNGHKRTVNHVEWNYNGNKLLSISESLCKIWDVHNSFKEMHSIEDEGILCGSWCVHKSIIAVNTGEMNIKIWNIEPHQITCLHTLEGHETYVTALHWHPIDGKRLISGSDDKTIRLWNALTGENLFIFHGHEHFVRAVQWHPAGDKIISGGYDRTARIWDVNTGEIIHIFYLDGNARVFNSISWNCDGNIIVSSSTEDTVMKLWEARSYLY